jgi:mono/diheme cytochrome c family protein
MTIRTSSPSTLQRMRGRNEAPTSAVSLVPLLVAATIFFALVAMAEALSPFPRGSQRPADPELTVPSGALATMIAPKTITNPDGHAVWVQNCATCHGVAGRGDGPASVIQQHPTPDLTRIALRDGGFDRIHVGVQIENMGMRSTGSMPCWGRLLRTGTGRQGTQLLIRNLVHHIETLQTSN